MLLICDTWQPCHSPFVRSGSVQLQSDRTGSVQLTPLQVAAEAVWNVYASLIPICWQDSARLVQDFHPMNGTHWRAFIQKKSVPLEITAEGRELLMCLFALDNRLVVEFESNLPIASVITSSLTQAAQKEFDELFQLGQTGHPGQEKWAIGSFTILWICFPVIRMHMFQFFGGAEFLTDCLRLHNDARR